MTGSSRERAAPTLAVTPESEVFGALRTCGLTLDMGALRVRVHSRLPEFAAQLRAAYAHYPLCVAECFADTTVSLLPDRGLRRWVRPLARIEIDGIDPFGPFNRAQLLPHFEWGVNWAFASMMNVHLLLHSGTVEVGDKGVLLIAAPGAGKSTLTAGLAGRGARLLSDEFGVVRVSDGLLLPMAKPTALKNRSIATLAAWAPKAQTGPIFRNTRKGDLTHQAVPPSSVARVHDPASPRLILFPQYREGSANALVPVAKARAFIELATNSFNYEVLGSAGFEAVARLLDRSACYRFVYGSLEDAVETVFRLCAELPDAICGTPDHSEETAV